jgi:hypothetical protein
MRRAVNGMLALLLAGGGLLAQGCGGNPQPKPDRIEVKEAVMGFFRDVARDDAEAICGRLTGLGRAQAIGHGLAPGQRPKPETKEKCIESGAPVPRSFADLPSVLKNGTLRLRQVKIADDRARAVVSVGALRGVERLARTDQGWKIDFFDIPVRD